MENNAFLTDKMNGLVECFKQQICRTFHLSEENFTLLIQAGIEGNYYLNSSGDLNRLVHTHSTRGNSWKTTGEDDFLQFMEQEIALSDNRFSTRINHLTTLKKLHQFRPVIRFNDINYTMLCDFKQYLLTQQMATNTIAKHLKHLKRYINLAIDQERIKHSPFRKFKIHQAETHKSSLTLQELELIEKFRENYSYTDEWIEVVDAFLFSCYTGMRYSDIATIGIQHIQLQNHKHWIVMETHKTNVTVHIPLYLLFGGKGIAIVNKYKKRKESLFHLPPNNKVNRIIGELMNKIGIRKHITFHSARHTNATLLLYKGVSITTVQKLLGHKNLRTTQVYSAVTELTLVKELKEAEGKRKRK